MIEIINIFSLFNDNKPIKSFHLAEGPVVLLTFNFHEKIKKIYLYNLLSNDTNVPFWKKSRKLYEN